MVGNWHLFTILTLPGSALGGMARIWLAALVDIAIGTAFPLGILSVNVLGSS